MRKDWIEADPGPDEASFVAEFWDSKWEAAEDTSGLLAVGSSEEYAFVRRVEPRLPTAALDVLDCGCGRGEWTRFLRDQGHRAIGVDIAKRTIEALTTRHAFFRLGDFRDLKMPDSSFDLVLNWGGIEHFEEGPQRSIREAKRVLRPGGLFVATTPCHNLRIRLLDANRPPAPKSEAARFYQYRFRPNELAAEFEAGGFGEMRTRTIGGENGARAAGYAPLRLIGGRLPRLARIALQRTAGRALRPLLGHMVICAGRKPRSAAEAANRA